MLGSTFGTKKTMSMIRSAERNQIDYDSIQDISNEIHQLVDHNIQNDDAQRREERAALAQQLEEKKQARAKKQKSTASSTQ